ncbi:MAG: hypothetical protein RIS73_2332 [Bacteroidota bacterium]|jgi:hypothetical protein
MRSKKIINVFLILVLAIQLLPVRQIISYFFIDNQLTEEIIEVEKGATKNIKQLDEDKLIHDFDISINQFLSLNKESFFHFADRLPMLYTAEILTPPPNCI